MLGLMVMLRRVVHHADLRVDLVSVTWCTEPSRSEGHPQWPPLHILPGGPPPRRRSPASQLSPQRAAPRPAHPSHPPRGLPSPLPLATRLAPCRPAPPQPLRFPPQPLRFPRRPVSLRARPATSARNSDSPREPPEASTRSSTSPTSPTSAAPCTATPASPSPAAHPSPRSASRPPRTAPPLGGSSPSPREPSPTRCYTSA